MDENTRVRHTEDMLDIRSDPVFKAVFTRECPESTGALSNLVSALIGREVTIVAILSNEPPIENIRDRQVRFDIKCRAKDGQLVNVEMCFNSHDFEPVRLEFHAAKLYIAQDIKGKDKNFDALKQAYQIGILAKKRFFKDKNYFHSFEYYDPENQVSLGGRTRIITLELIKANKIAEKPIDEMSVSEGWMYFFEYLTDKKKRDKINELLKKEEGINMANQVLMTISRDERERERLMQEEKILLDYYSGINYEKKKSHAEGRKERDQEIVDLWKSGMPAEEILRNLETSTIIPHTKTT